MRLLLGTTYAAEFTRACNNANLTLRLIAYNATTPTPRSHHAVAALYRALQTAPARGLRCTCLLQTFPAGSPQHAANQAAADHLAAHSWRIVPTAGTALLHAKLLIADDNALILGSHNLTHRGLTSPGEASMLITNHDTIAAAIAWYDALADYHRTRAHN